MPRSVTLLSFWLALVLSLGSLAFYFTGAYWNRLIAGKTTDFRYDFNLAVPGNRAREQLFATALIAAGSSVSTVFVFFLTTTTVFGLWVILSPVMFVIGNAVMFGVYSRIVKRGYLTEDGADRRGVAGLVPSLGMRLTRSALVGWLLVLLSFLNLTAVLVLELVVGVDIIGYVANGSFGHTLSPAGGFGVFACAVVMLLGYVFVGGFRAVVSSDVWQLKAMNIAVLAAVGSLVIFVVTIRPAAASSARLLVTPSGLLLSGFVINVVLANCLIPLSQEASWQRFRAFAQSPGFRLRSALGSSARMAFVLWFGLIVLAFLLQIAVPPAIASRISSMSTALEALRQVNDWWFPLFVFPVMTVAALSAMASTADTCVSSLLFLIEFARTSRAAHASHTNTSQVPGSYIWAMAGILGFSLLVYAFVRFWFSPTILQLVFSVFSNLVVVAPTVLTAAFVDPPKNAAAARRIRLLVIVSLTTGFVFYWTAGLAAIVLGSAYLWLSQLSIVAGLAGAAAPLLPVWASAGSKNIGAKP